MQRLLLDLGNTRLKWCLASSLENIRVQGVVDYTDLHGFLQEGVWQKESIESIWLASVSSGQYIQMIEQAFEDIEIHHLSSPAQRCGVINSYDQPDNLGIDRWLGLVAARHLYKTDVMVIDAGTALTIDVINRQGKHQGGYIVPGLNMMRQTLASSTSNLPDAHIAGEGLGTSTLSAIANGTLTMLVDFVATTYQSCSSQFNDMQVVLTGGDGQVLYNKLPFTLNHDPDWVLKGLWFESEAARK